MKEGPFLLLALSALLCGALIFRKLWLGALSALCIALFHKIFSAPRGPGVFEIFGNSFIISAELALLLCGAFMFHHVLMSQNHFAAFITMAGRFSSRLLLLMILCWFMGSFMEGIAGFGIPAMLIAPLMLSTGFKPLTCIVLPLAATTLAVNFGALGTPLVTGMGITKLSSTAEQVLLLNTLIALLLPFALTVLYCKTEQQKIHWRREWKIPAGAGICFALPFFFSGRFSLELPSVAAGAAGLIIFVSIFLQPHEQPGRKFWAQFFWPYICLVVLLLLVIKVGPAFSWQPAPGLREVSLRQPGIVFFITAFIVLTIYRRKWPGSSYRLQFIKTVKKMYKPLFTIALLVTFSQNVQHDIILLSNTLFVNQTSPLILALVPVAGIFGSFVTGSATMSNLLLHGGIASAFSAGNFHSLPPALLNTGGAIGNTISFQNIVMVRSVIQHDAGYAGILVRSGLFAGFYLLLLILFTLLLF